MEHKPFVKLSGKRRQKTLSCTTTPSRRPTYSQQRMAGFVLLSSSGESGLKQAFPHSSASPLQLAEGFLCLAACGQILALLLHLCRAKQQHFHPQGWRKLTRSHELIDFLRTAFGALHAVVFLQQLIDLRQVNPGVRGHAVGRDFPQQNTKSCSGGKKKSISFVFIFNSRGCLVGAVTKQCCT